MCSCVLHSLCCTVTSGKCLEVHCLELGQQYRYFCIDGVHVQNKPSRGSSYVTSSGSSSMPAKLAPCRDPRLCRSVAVSQFRVCILQRTRTFAVFEGESLLNASAVVNCDGLAFGAFPGCVTRCFTLTSRFLPPRPAKVTIYTMRCRHFLSFCLLFQVCKEPWNMWGHEGS